MNGWIPSVQRSVQVNQWCSQIEQIWLKHPPINDNQKLTWSNTTLTWFLTFSFGQGRPPLKGFSLNHRARTFTPPPQGALHEDQVDHSLSLQSRGQGTTHFSSSTPVKRYPLLLVTSNQYVYLISPRQVESKILSFLPRIAFISAVMQGNDFYKDALYRLRAWFTL